VVIQRWAAAEQALSTDPVGAIKHLAQSYGVDLAQLAGQPGEERQVNPELLALRREVTELRGSYESRVRAEQESQRAVVVNEITQFADAKDESGAPRHPFFEEVFDDLLILAQAERAAGRVPKLDDLYDRAVWANPTTRARQMTSQREAEARKQAEGAKVRSAAALRAGGSVTGAPNGSGASPSAPKSSLREELEAAWSS